MPVTSGLRGAEQRGQINHYLVRSQIKLTLFLCLQLFSLVEVPVTGNIQEHSDSLIIILKCWLRTAPCESYPTFRDTTTVRNSILTMHATLPRSG